jgi:hypothetical protein
MFTRWAALVSVLALCAMSPKNAAGQSTQSSRGHGAKGKIGANYPNPFNPDTKLNFSVGEPGCVPGVGQYNVTIQIVNVLAQPVVNPVLYGVSQTSTSSISTASGPIVNMKLACGDYVAYWDGRLADHRREAASGVYGVILNVDRDPPVTSKIYYKK